MRAFLFAAAATTMLVTAVPASAHDNNGGGYDYGPLGQCFDARVCGHGRGAYASAHACSIYRERVVTQSGRVIFKRHRVCT
jgi:hypothetical protein